MSSGAEAMDLNMATNSYIQFFFVTAFNFKIVFFSSSDDDSSCLPVLAFLFVFYSKSGISVNQVTNSRNIETMDQKGLHSDE